MKLGIFAALLVVPACVFGQDQNPPKLFDLKKIKRSMESRVKMIRVIINWFKLQYDMNFSYWYVIYPDGKKSCAMPYCHAFQYMAIFGGRLVKHEPRENDEDF